VAQARGNAAAGDLVARVGDSNFAVWLPGALRSHRYRPAKGWDASPVWFAGPPEPVAAVQAAEPGDVVRGGASGSW